MNALIEFAALARAHPGPDASTDQVTAWYEAKGQLHEHLAAGARDPAEESAELAYAAAAYEHARRLARQARPAGPDLVTVGGRSS
jgi:hypothetical protein